MIDLLTMLPQQVHPVVIAVRGSDDGVNVLARGFVVVESHAALVIKLNEDDGAVPTVVEGLYASMLPIQAKCVDS
jgi:hypothetical protein